MQGDFLFDIDSAPVSLQKFYVDIMSSISKDHAIEIIQGLYNPLGSIHRPMDIDLSVASGIWTNFNTLLIHHKLHDEHLTHDDLCLLAAYALFPYSFKFERLLAMFIDFKQGKLNARFDDLRASLPSHKSWEVNIDSSPLHDRPSFWSVVSRVLDIIVVLRELDQENPTTAVNVLVILAKYEWVYEGMSSITTVLQAKRAKEQVDKLLTELTALGLQFPGVMANRIV